MQRLFLVFLVFTNYAILLFFSLFFGFNCKKDAIEDSLESKQIFLFVISKNGAHLRESNSQKSKSLMVLPFSKPVVLVEKSDEEVLIQDKNGFWFKVRHDEKEGFMFSSFLSEEDPIKRFNPSKTLYAVRKFQNLCDSDAQDDCIIYSIKDLDHKEIFSIHSSSPIIWVNDSEILSYIHFADGGGYGYSETKRNVLTKESEDIYSYEGEFDNESEGLASQYHCVLKNCIGFHFDKNKNLLSIKEFRVYSDKKNPQKLIYSIKSKNLNSVDLNDISRILIVDEKKSLNEKNKIYFQFDKNSYAVMFPELRIKKL